MHTNPKMEGELPEMDIVVSLFHSGPLRVTGEWGYINRAAVRFQPFLFFPPPPIFALQTQVVLLSSLSSLSLYDCVVHTLPSTHYAARI